MKQTIFLVLLLLGLYSCESTPEVTSCVPLRTESSEYGTDSYGNVVFKGKKETTAGWVHWDENKKCPNQHDAYFRTIKSTPSAILKSDRCTRCGFTWNLHD